MATTSQTPQVAITGLGVVCALGNSVPAALGRARVGDSGIRAYTSPTVPADHPLHRRVGGTVVDFTPPPTLEPRFAARQEPGVLFALAAAAEALAHAGLADHAGDRDRWGCAIGAGLAGAELWHRAVGGALRGEPIARMTAIAITGTAVTGLLALTHRLRGPSWGVANACASGTSAIALAADQLRLGRADVMVVGGCESSMRGLVSYGSFADGQTGMHVTTEPVGACAPFARDRRGFVLAEGAGVLVLERLDHARARGARPLAMVAGTAIVNDAHHVISPEPTGIAWARAMRLALDDAGLDPAQVDAINAHGTATPQGDLAEARAIHRLLGGRAARVPVSATKSMHGHAFGAAGAIETALAVAAMADGVVLPTINLGDPDPACALDHVRGVARRAEVGVLVKNGFGAGGVATSLVLTHPDHAAVRAAAAPRDDFAF